MEGFTNTQDLYMAQNQPAAAIISHRTGAVKSEIPFSQNRDTELQEIPSPTEIAAAARRKIVMKTANAKVLEETMKNGFSPVSNSSPSYSLSQFS